MTGVFLMKKCVPIVIAAMAFCSCSAPTYLNCPTIYYPGVSNECTFTVQNMDEQATVESTKMTCHYDGFDVKYEVINGFVVTFEIYNNTNKSMIIDKSKCYVLYNGYSNQLFKDVRSTRSTTFNNVQDAINNVQTNEGGVSMTIPPYSKWAIPPQESNLQAFNNFPEFEWNPGSYSLSVFDNQDVIEFIIPYTFDYTLAEWKTIRNRVYVGMIEAKYIERTYNFNNTQPTLTSTNMYEILRHKGKPDLTEARRIQAINQKRFDKHDRQVWWGNFSFAVVTLPILWWMWALVPDPDLGCTDSAHLPPQCIE